MPKLFSIGILGWCMVRNVTSQEMESWAPSGPFFNHLHGLQEAFDVSEPYPSLTLIDWYSILRRSS